MNNMQDNKLLGGLLSLTLLVLIFFLLTLARNNLTENRFIGKSPEHPETITVAATGNVDVVPDIAVTNIGFITEAATVAVAQKENTEVMNRVTKRLKDMGIAEEDVQTKNYNIRPQYDYREEGRQLRGYQVSQSLQVKIRDIDKANHVLALAGEEGVNNVSGLQFTVDDSDSALAQAREEAIEKVETKKENLEDALNITIGDVVGYDEFQGGGYEEPYYRAFGGEALSADVAAPQVQAGSEEISLQVSVTYEIR